MKSRTNFIIAAFCLLSVSSSHSADRDRFLPAENHGKQAQQAFVQCMDFVHGWLAHRDPKSGLIPRNLSESFFWNAKDSAADNYPFMVLTCALLDRDLYRGTMRRMLEQETKLTRRLKNLPDDYDFATQTFLTPKLNLDDLLFGGSEYVKDGLVPLTEWLGESPWSERMLGIMDSIWAYAPVETPYGLIPSTVDEVVGDNMQVLARLYWMTGNEKYKEWAFRLGDSYLLDHLPTDTDRLQLDDHGCEVVDGLAGVYYLASKTDPERYEKYRKPVHRMIDRILEAGVNEDGLVYMVINPKTGEILNSELSDNWGYNYNAILNVAQVDGDERYLAATRRLLENIHKYPDYPWEGGGSDGYADAIEGGINLLNRIPVDSGFEWVETSMRTLQKKQRPDGIIEGWHGDGNFARTLLMYALWKTQGAHVQPWRADLSFGAVREGDALLVSLRSDWPWKGTLQLDLPRHKEFMKLPSDYPRINQFPEWYTVEPSQKYQVTIDDQAREVMTGRELRRGLAMSLQQGKPVAVEIEPVSTP